MKTAHKNEVPLPLQEPGHWLVPTYPLLPVNANNTSLRTILRDIVTEKKQLEVSIPALGQSGNETKHQVSSISF